MQQTLPLVLIALGSVAVVALRDARLLAAALVVQWGGLVWLVVSLMPEARVGWAELATALICVALLGWTAVTLHNTRIDDLPGFSEAHRGIWELQQDRRAWQSAEGNLADKALLLVTAIAGGVAGFGLARLYSLGSSEEANIAFYWILLSAILSLVLHGARDLLKLGVGLLVLMNAVALVVETMSVGVLSNLTLGLLGACRIGLVVLISYLLVVLKVRLLDADLDDIFDARAGIVPGSMALVPVGLTEQDYMSDPEPETMDEEIVAEAQEGSEEGHEEKSEAIEDVPNESHEVKSGG